MEKMLLSIPDSLALRMRVVMPTGQRSQIIAALIEKEVRKREQSLFECAQDLEKDKGLSKEMDEWNVTLRDGLHHAKSR